MAQAPVSPDAPRPDSLRAAGDGEIHHVSDTALWVAVYRAIESERPDALFRDPYAARLTGERGRRIAESMPLGHFTAWTVVVRTVMIDEYIRELVDKRGVDMVINLGAGLDTRPYRMDLPASLKWVEADYPHMIALKNEKLGSERPRCRLERVAVDLADVAARRALFARLGSDAKNALVLTEGVIPYLTVPQVAELALDLRAQASFRYWITEYFTQESYRYLRDAKRRHKMRNAPFVFFPDDWVGLFEGHGWKELETKYHSDVGDRIGRPAPLPFWIRFILRVVRRRDGGKARRFAGYRLLVPAG
jgi:methyltransferase (TIGR00027 family)